MLTKAHMVAAGLPDAQAGALATAGAGLNWLQWVQLALQILTQLGGQLGPILGGIKTSPAP